MKVVMSIMPLFTNAKEIYKKSNYVSLYMERHFEKIDYEFIDMNIRNLYYCM